MCSKPKFEEQPKQVEAPAVSAPSSADQQTASLGNEVTPLQPKKRGKNSLRISNATSATGLNI